jgi:hypothetical protein
MVVPLHSRGQGAIDLSPAERAQLGAPRLRRDGTPSAHPYPSAEQWPRIRDYLVARSLRSNPLPDEALTAYTPGETLDLLRHPLVAAWHAREAVSRIPEEYSAIMLVPCAKTKPWVGPSVRRSKLYSAYNTLISEFPQVCFATISEPLGIVPMQDWASFPQYDNPGLFRDDTQRSGMTTAEWAASPFARCYGLPFDAEAHAASIALLGSVVRRFVARNCDRLVISVVDEASGALSTHAAMLDHALATSGAGVAVHRHPKRVVPRVSPLGYLRELIGGLVTDAAAQPALRRAA